MIPPRFPPLASERATRASLAWAWTAPGGELVTPFAGAALRGAPRAFASRVSSPGGSSRDTDRGVAAAAPGETPGSDRSSLDPSPEASEFAGDAWLAADPRAPHFLLGGLTVMLSHRLGGGVLHAASVELDGGVVAFVGPSGAGKTTACRHVAGAPLVSVDRLAVVPRGSTWFAHPLPGGTRPLPDLPSATPRWRPLAGVLRVRQSANGTAVETPSPALGVTSLRESTFQSGLGPSAELELLGALEHLVQHVPVGRLELQLGASLRPLLRRWLESQTPDRR